MSSPIDLSQVPMPDVIEVPDFEVLLTERKKALLDLFDGEERAALEDVLALESEPLTKHLEENTYREMVLRQRINEAAVAGMLAANRGSDLDGVASRYETQRMLGESDERLRHRTQQAFYQVACAGPASRYRQIALAAHADVVAVDAWQQSPGVVRVAILARDTVAANSATSEQLTIGSGLFGATGDDTTAHIVGSPDSPAYSSARARLMADDVRPLGVDLHVSPPSVTRYTVSATLMVPRGPDPQRILNNAREQLDQESKRLATFRVDIHRTAIINALMVDGVRTVDLESPTADMARGPGELAVCGMIEIAVEVQDD